LVVKRRKGLIWDRICVEFISQDELADDHVVEIEDKMSIKQVCSYRKLEDQYK
jgi:hypothetical protein